MTTELQDIAIMEDKPLLTGQADGAKVTHLTTKITLTNIHWPSTERADLMKGCVMVCLIRHIQAIRFLYVHYFDLELK